MSTSNNQTSPFELTGMSGRPIAQYAFEFQGETYIVDDTYGNFAADADGSLLGDGSFNGLPHHTTVGSDEPFGHGHGHLTTTFAGPSTAGTYSVAGSYGESSISIQNNRPHPTSASLSQVSGYYPTPSTSEQEFIDHNPQVDDSVSSFNGYHPQHLISQFPTENNSPTPREAWYDDNQRHESIAYRLAKPATEPSKEKKPAKKSHKARKHK
jgi:hypothetical protein